MVVIVKSATFIAICLENEDGINYQPSFPFGVKLDQVTNFEFAENKKLMKMCSLFVYHDRVSAENWKTFNGKQNTFYTGRVFQYFQQLVNATGSLVSSGFHDAREKYICARPI